MFELSLVSLISIFHSCPKGSQWFNKLSSQAFHQKMKCLKHQGFISAKKTFIFTHLLEKNSLLKESMIVSLILLSNY